MSESNENQEKKWYVFLFEVSKENVSVIYFS